MRHKTGGLALGVDKKREGKNIRGVVPVKVLKILSGLENSSL